VRGRWAAGIVPRNFTWVIRDHLAISERPGGYAPTHRRVRRQEEIFWLRGHGFTRVVSLLPSVHNLHAYSELGVQWSHFPMPADADVAALVNDLYPQLVEWMRSGERILIHQDELSDRVMGIAGGFLLWSGLLSEGPRAITVLEQIAKRQMGSAGRAVIALVGELLGTADAAPSPVPAAKVDPPATTDATPTPPPKRPKPAPKQVGAAKKASSTRRR
jgi:hypothetical protein